MLIDGVSMKGNYHGMNQDSYGFRFLDRGFIAALSDGLGSKKMSHLGSEALCMSAVEIAEELKESLSDISAEGYIEKVHIRWKEKLVRYDITECYATMLIFVRYGGRGFAVRLGDGFIGIWANGQIRVLFDRKEESFANETDCLTEELCKDKLEIYELDVSEAPDVSEPSDGWGLRGGVMCSDGVGIGNMLETELSGFTREFTEGYCDMEKAEITEDIASWLKDWPGADDKTLVYFIAERK